VLYGLVLLASPLSILLQTHSSQAAAPYQASDVLGQSDFTSDYINGVAPPPHTALAGGYTQSTVIDPVNHRLFVADSGNNRVLVFDLNTDDTLQDLMADHVLGQPDPNGNANDTNAKGFYFNCGNGGGALAYDAVNNQLFVADTCNNRVLIFDLSGGITNNMDASYVLGQADFTSGGAHINAKGFSYPKGMDYDAGHKRLFVSDNGNNRVLIFDLSGGITNNMDASHVLGQSDFTSSGSDTNAKGFSLGSNAGSAISYDVNNNRLFVSDIGNNRVLIFDLSGGITNNMDASYVLGQADFTSGGSDTNAKGFYMAGIGGGLAYDTNNNRLFVADTYNNRVLIFDLSGGITNNMDAVHVLGPADFTSNNTGTFTYAIGVSYDASQDVLVFNDYWQGYIFDVDPANPNFGDNMAATQNFGNNNSTADMNASGLYTYYGAGSSIDTVHHRLFVGDSYNYRILVYNLDNNNNLIDHTADHVLGSDNFTSYSHGVGDAGIMYDVVPEYDAVHDRLFVADLDSDCRVMVFDLSNGITNGMDATYVLGQPDFHTTNCGSNRNQFNYSYAGDVAYDPSSELLYVNDSYTNNRIMVYDVSPGTIHNGEDASYVLGTSDPDSAGNGGCAKNEIAYNYTGGLIVDPAHHRLFVAQYDCFNILVFDTSNLSNGMDASYVLGCIDFGCSSYASDHGVVSGVEGLAYDPVQQLLVAFNYSCGDAKIFDLSNGITNGMDAVATLGQSAFGACDLSGTSQAGFYFDYGGDGVFDSANRRLYVPDDYNNRIMIFNFIKLADANPAAATLGSNYSQTLASNFQGTLNWQVTSGSLPAGLSFTTDGKLAGTPTVAGTYSFSVTATDDNGPIGSFKDSKAYSMQVLAASTDGGSSSSSGSSNSKKKTVTTASTDTGTTTGTDIVLNNFNEYFTDTGKTIDNLKAGDSLHFCTSSATTCDPTNPNYHSITVKSINSTTSTVVLTFHSDPIDVSFTTDTAQAVDVDNDGTNDITAIFNGITNGLASFTFRSITKAANTTTQITPTDTNTATMVGIRTKKSLLPWFLIAGAIILAAVTWLIARARKKQPPIGQGPTFTPQL
jgi:sugar lactone lactonase YvrE